MNLHMTRMIRVAILGASGYVGGELMRLIAAHPAMEVGVAFGASNAGQPVGAIHPHLSLAYPDMKFAAWNSSLLEGCELILAALPHGETQRLADALRKRGLVAEGFAIEARDCSIGESLQVGAIEHGARLLVMGGYGHSRMRDFVLGGATEGVLNDLRLPVLLSH